MLYEYKVIPAPSKGRKAPGVKSAEDRFALGLEEVMNTLAEDRWEYVRSDLLPSEERQGFRSSRTVYRSVLVFRRVAEMGDMYMGDPDEGATYAQALTARRPLAEAPAPTAGFTPVGPAFRHEEPEEEPMEEPDPMQDLPEDETAQTNWDDPDAADMPDPDHEPRNS